MRRLCALLLLLATLASTEPARAQVSVSIGINVPVFPELVVVPGYPVYYAPRMNADYFFFDGFYWVFNVEDGQWYSSSWYNGPWVFVEPVYVPQPLLMIPFRYYRLRPAYWGGWANNAPPRWGQHWGRDWESRRTGWDRWDRNRAPAAAPLPTYQRDFPRDRYPAPAQQVNIHNERYKYQARDANVQQERAAIFRQQSAGGAKATSKAARVENPRADTPDRERRQETPPPPARSQRQETVKPPAAPRREPQPSAPREQAAPQQAPRRERPQETVQPPAAPRREPQPSAPREQPAPQQAPRGERPGQPPAKEERQQERQQGRQQERQQEKGPQGRSEEGPGKGRR